jgi:tetratricopeptide (TPR) repeat protein
MNNSIRSLIAVLATVTLVAAGPTLAAQEPLAEVRALYAAASYEAALSALATLDPAPETRGEAEQYRAFCLIALGRTADAERAIEGVVAADPLYVPQSADVSPRVRAMFTDVRRRMLPEIARRAYLEGRSAFQAKNLAAASTQFERVMRLIDQSDAESAAAMEDLRILVSGFVELTRAATERPSPEGRRSETPMSAAVAAPQQRRSGDDYLPPVAVDQELPRWNPPSAAIGERAYAGAVKILIGSDGTVQDASMVKPVHPLYDPVLLQAARRWVYQPATRLGEPTAAEKIVQIRLTPR